MFNSCFRNKSLRSIEHIETALGDDGLYANAILMIWKMIIMRTAVQSRRSEVVAFISGTKFKFVTLSSTSAAQLLECTWKQFCLCQLYVRLQTRVLRVVCRRYDGSEAFLDTQLYWGDESSFWEIFQQVPREEQRVEIESGGPVLCTIRNGPKYYPPGDKVVPPVSPEIMPFFPNFFFLSIFFSRFFSRYPGTGRCVPGFLEIVPDWGRFFPT